MATCQEMSRVYSVYSPLNLLNPFRIERVLGGKFVFLQEAGSRKNVGFGGHDEGWSMLECWNVAEAD